MRVYFEVRSYYPKNYLEVDEGWANVQPEEYYVETVQESIKRRLDRKGYVPMQFYEVAKFAGTPGVVYLDVTIKRKPRKQVLDPQEDWNLNREVEIGSMSFAIHRTPENLITITRKPKERRNGYHKPPGAPDGFMTEAAAREWINKHGETEFDYFISISSQRRSFYKGFNQILGEKKLKGIA